MDDGKFITGDTVKVYYRTPRTLGDYDFIFVGFINVHSNRMHSFFPYIIYSPQHGYAFAIGGKSDSKLNSKMAHVPMLLMEKKYDGYDRW